jgi:hypothetical protein
VRYVGTPGFLELLLLTENRHVLAALERQGSRKGKKRGSWLPRPADAPSIQTVGAGAEGPGLLVITFPTGSRSGGVGEPPPPMFCLRTALSTQTPFPSSVRAV